MKHSTLVLLVLPVICCMTSGYIHDIICGSSQLCTWLPKKSLSAKNYYGFYWPSPLFIFPTLRVS